MSQNHRFFVSPDWFQGRQVVITGDLVHQMSNVLRFRQGERVILLDNSGLEYEVQLVDLGKEKVTGVVLQRWPSIAEPAVKITLYQALLKGDRFEFALQKGTEIGVSEFVPVISDRCVVSNVETLDNQRYHRWQRIIVEAAEQSHRGKVPYLNPAMLLSAAFERTRLEGLSLLPWESEVVSSIRTLLRQHFGPVDARRMTAGRRRQVNLFVGPEGGFSDSEISAARNYDVRPVTLGPRILRAETAGLIASAVILYELGDLG
ncbi:MAG: 16S rRNA (uracil(1498)-N(3))-methyltransferase [Chloroflexi bacterium]|nr:16S rRNA (uracil(1498)-N(3))-methyltransferase [Chloroflexota bacterium]